MNDGAEFYLARILDTPLYYRVFGSKGETVVADREESERLVEAGGFFVPVDYGYWEKK